jgi:hypothetical protein
VTDLLLITDVPRLRKNFSRLSDDRNIRLRIANNLEKGAEELAAEKPGIVFVQTHLSGLSAEIILMHLKKQLGRKRTRFVLLSPPAEAGSEILRLYQGHIDTTQGDEPLLNSIKEMIASLLTKAAKKAAEETAAPEVTPVEPEPLQTETVVENVPALISPLQGTDRPPTPQEEEPSLVDQGITYAPRARMSVYSEFNSSFDSAVSDMKPAVALVNAAPEQNHAWHSDGIETIEPATARSKRAVFLLWLAPVVIAVVVITMLQHKRSAPASTAATPKAPTPPVAATVSEHPAAIQTFQPDSSAVPVQPLKTASPRSTAEPDSALSDKAVLSAIAENRARKDQAKATPGSSRLTLLPDFIPRSHADKAYATANPGWERYKGLVTEFKVFRENSSIKAIQVIDRGGNGVPESFMKATLRQVSNNPAFVLESSEKKEGFEIQRGKVTENLKVMYYRDESGGKLRAYVLTWQ